ncbi:hypothetical protein [Paludisphaera soli]|nr:hypothetical protein [Paludisphaera soli]
MIESSAQLELIKFQPLAQKQQAILEKSTSQMQTFADARSVIAGLR